MTKKKSKETIAYHRARVMSGYGPHKMLRLEMEKIRDNVEDEEE